MNEPTIRHIDPGTPVDLTNCDREPIHLLGRVQSYGALVALSPDWVIQHASENLGTILDHHDGEVTNIILVDLMTGERHAITDVPAGTRALFPHFRSDGWFYFLVMDGERELIIASDAALVIAGG